MARYIDADKLVAELDKMVYDYCADTSMQSSIAAGVVADIRDNVLKTIPAADVVEVSRCENCQLWDEEEKELHTYSSDDDTLVYFAECKKFSDYVTCYMTRYNDYCSQAKKKGGDK